MNNLAPLMSMVCGLIVLAAMAAGSKPTYFTQTCWVIAAIFWAAQAVK